MHLSTIRKSSLTAGYIVSDASVHYNVKHFNIVNSRFDETSHSVTLPPIQKCIAFSARSGQERIGHFPFSWWQRNVSSQMAARCADSLAQPSVLRPACCFNNASLSSAKMSTQSLLGDRTGWYRFTGSLGCLYPVRRRKAFG